MGEQNRQEVKTFMYYERIEATNAGKCLHSLSDVFFLVGKFCGFFGTVSCTIFLAGVPHLPDKH